MGDILFWLSSQVNSTLSTRLAKKDVRTSGFQTYFGPALMLGHDLCVQNSETTPLNMRRYSKNSKTTTQVSIQTSIAHPTLVGLKPTIQRNPFSLIHIFWHHHNRLEAPLQQRSLDEWLAQKQGSRSRLLLLTSSTAIVVLGTGILLNLPAGAALR